MATKKAKFPVDLFVIIETSGGESYLVAHERPEDVAEVGKTISVARYSLVGVSKVSTKVEVS